MPRDIDTTPLSELKRNFAAAAALLLVIGLGALLYVALMDIW